MSDPNRQMSDDHQDSGVYSTELTGADNLGGERREPGFDDADVQDEQSGEDEPETTTGDPTKGPGGQIEPRDAEANGSAQQSRADLGTQMNEDLSVLGAG